MPKRPNRTGAFQICQLESFGILLSRHLRFRLNCWLLLKIFPNKNVEAKIWCWFPLKPHPVFRFFEWLSIFFHPRNRWVSVEAKLRRDCFIVPKGEVPSEVGMSNKNSEASCGGTVDGRNPANQLRLVVYPIIYRGSAPSQVVVWDFFHQQYGACFVWKIPWEYEV